MSPPGRKIKCLTLREKIDIIKAVDNGTKRKAIMEQYQVPASTLCCILRRRDQLLKKMKDRAVSLSSKRIRTVDSPELEARMKAFIDECRRDDVTPTGNLLLSKARELAVTLGLTNFRASNGWLCNFKKRQGMYPRRNKIVISLTRPDHASANDDNQEECSSTTENKQMECTVYVKQEVDPAGGGTTPAPADIKVERLDSDAPEHCEDSDDYNYRIGVLENASTTRGENGASQRGELARAGEGSGGEDEFDRFGKYIASALRAMPGRMSIVARTELQITLSRMQMKCTA